MNGPESKNTFMPKQALIPTADLFKELTADAMENMSRSSLAQISIPPGAVVHDNGCGVGAGSNAFFEKQPEITIKATDIDDRALEICRQRTSAWPAEVSHMDSNKLTFPDGTFSHSLANALIFVLPNDGVDGVKEMYRTLQPGGIALINSIAYGPNIIPIQQTAARTRPEGTPLPRQGSEKWHSSDFLKSVVEQGGFTDVKMAQTSYHSTTKTDLTRFSTMLWSFVGGTGAAGWLESDEERWDEAIGVLSEELQKAKGFKVTEDGLQLEFLLNIAIATK